MSKVIQNAERLTDSEKDHLATANKKISIAESELYDLKAKIANAHNMIPLSWPEYRDTVQVDEGFIIFYRTYSMVD